MGRSRAWAVTAMGNSSAARPSCWGIQGGPSPLGGSRAASPGHSAARETASAGKDERGFGGEKGKSRSNARCPFSPPIAPDVELLRLAVPLFRARSLPWRHGGAQRPTDEGERSACRLAAAHVAAWRRLRASGHNTADGAAAILVSRIQEITTHVFSPSRRSAPGLKNRRESLISAERW